MTLVLVSSGGDVLGALPPFEVELPWWSEVTSVVSAARSRFGVAVTVLRLLSTSLPEQPGGAVTYLAEVASAVGIALAPASVDLAPHPLRAPYASVGGPSRSLRWAGSFSAAVQVKTWNLSSLWRLETGDGTVWLKELPTFLRGETAVLRWVNAVAPDAAPTLLAADGEGRQLLSHLPGEDRFGAPEADRLPMAELLHGIQVRFLADRPGLDGIRDRRGPLLLEQITAVASPWLARIDGLEEVIAALPGRLAQLAACGVPETLVHGDFHPGNVRSSDGVRPAALDWGDAFLGHPGFDILRLSVGLASSTALLDRWASLWRAAVPGCDPLRAVALLRPVAPLLGAVVYGAFLENIEPSEWPYHLEDVPNCLKAAVENFVVPML
ncbi:aminoglycoside phosphotransferase family protein [Dactylosporangium sp. NBC_01737]|uniref:phosphotransferase family protein n=1 Tax=Dactylosporangium sp. NBC_01737 TaxID=2975959 RepID=UPI002E12248A|nr:aminoglycoside phosphotransferase family protein [Dactylosporangium sp. NBC_01737]